MPEQNIENRFNQYLRNTSRTTVVSSQNTFACVYCDDQHVLHGQPELWKHVRIKHKERVPSDAAAQAKFRAIYEQESVRKSTDQDAPVSPQGPIVKLAKRQWEPKSPLPIQTISTLAATECSRSSTKDDSVTIDSRDVQLDTDARTKTTIHGNDTSISSVSPTCHYEHVRRDKTKADDEDAVFRRDARWTSAPNKQLWTPDSESRVPRRFVDPSNIASHSVACTRAQGLLKSPRKPFNTSPKTSSPRSAYSPGCPPHKSGSPMILTSKDDIRLLPQPDIRNISSEELQAEVKGIYAGLVLVEAKCIEIDARNAVLVEGNQNESLVIRDDQWQAMLTLHRTLLQEHHDFFLASQHPAASSGLRRLAAKYAMPARMWRHGIHAFLELLRHSLPSSLDHMVNFIYFAYPMMTLLYESVPAFEDTWIECLGDLARYRMAIEDSDLRDREIWSGVARDWYSIASDSLPTTGRLYHHLAILARPDSLRQLYFYSKSLCVASPFMAARESILTLFDPVLQEAAKNPHLAKQSPFIIAFLRVHAMMFTGSSAEQYSLACDHFTGLLNGHIGSVTTKFVVQGYQIAIANCAALLGYGDRASELMHAMCSDAAHGVGQEVTSGKTAPEVTSGEKKDGAAAQLLLNSLTLHLRTTEIVLDRIGDPNILSYVHVVLVLLLRASTRRPLLKVLSLYTPWAKLASFLNALHAQYMDILSTLALSLDDGDDEAKVLPEDRAMRGLLFAEGYFSVGHFGPTTGDHVTRGGSMGERGEDDKDKKDDIRVKARRSRVVWLGRKLALNLAQQHEDGVDEMLKWNASTERFESQTPSSTVELTKVPIDNVDQIKAFDADDRIPTFSSASTVEGSQTAESNDAQSEADEQTIHSSSSCAEGGGD